MSFYFIIEISCNVVLQIYSICYHHPLSDYRSVKPSVLLFKSGNSFEAAGGYMNTTTSRKCIVFLVSKHNKKWS